MASTLEQRRRSFGGGPREPSYLADRFIVGLILAAIAVAAAVAMLTTIGLIEPSLMLPQGATLEQWVRFDHLAEPNKTAARVGVVLGAALVGIIAVRLLYRRIVPAPREEVGTTHVLMADDKGIVEVEERGICTVAAEAVLRINGVLEAEVETLGSGSGPVLLRITAWMHAGADVANSKDAILHQAVAAVETLIGLEVYDTRVEIRMVPLEEMGRRVLE